MGERLVGTVTLLRRYPVKSMLGEAEETLAVTTRGVSGDREWAVIDTQTGKVASAKRANLWRHLLGCEARLLGDLTVQVVLPGGAVHTAGEPEIDRLLSALTGRQVVLGRIPPDKAEVERSHPEAVLTEGLDADVSFDPLQLGGAAPPGTFLDYAPLHLLTSATLDGLNAAMPDAQPVEEIRYRANVVIKSPDGTAVFPENEWVGGVLRVGASVALRVVLQTPRCAIPTLAHGALPPRPAALRAATERNRIDIPGFGKQPAAGVYTDVLSIGTIHLGDRVTFTPA